MKKFTKYRWFMILFVVAALLFFLSHFTNGVRESNLEVDAREKQHIPSEWVAVSSSTDEVGALLFYDPLSIDDYTYSIYVHKHRLVPGYVFSSGGKRSEIASLCEIRMDKYGSVLFSLNRDHITRIKFSDGAVNGEYRVDADTPFCLALPKNYGTIKMQDKNGKAIEERIIIEE